MLAFTSRCSLASRTRGANPDDLRVFWFELFECVRKIMLVGMPVFFEVGSVSQLTFALLVCFISFGLYMMFSPYADDSDDRLAQLCQMQIFFSLVSSLLLKWDKVAAEQEGNRGTQNLDVLVRAARSFSIPARSFSHMLTRPQTVRVSPPAQLCTFTFLPVAFGLITHFLSEGLYDYFKEGWIDPAKEWLRPRLEPMLIGARRIHRLRGSASSKSFVRPWLRVTCGGSSTECWRKTRTAISPTMGSGEL